MKPGVWKLQVHSHKINCRENLHTLEKGKNELKSCCIALKQLAKQNTKNIIEQAPISFFIIINIQHGLPRTLFSLRKNPLLPT